MSEFSVISNYFKRFNQHAARSESLFKLPSKPSAVECGIGDDAAIISAPNKVVVCVDTLVEGVHFPSATSPEDIGYKALAVNLSDFAAMGATPRWMTLALTLPEASDAWLAAFTAGLNELACQYAVELVGGDTTQGPLTISIQLMGELVGNLPPLLRSGAQPGDIIAVSGDLGGAAVGLEQVLNRSDIHQPLEVDGIEAEAVERLNRPIPRVELGLLLREFATSCIDLSDGLAGDLGHLCQASNCTASIDVEQLPIHSSLLSVSVESDSIAGSKDALKQDSFAAFKKRFCSLSGHQLESDKYINAFKRAVSFGDDYELLFTIPEKQWEAFMLSQSSLDLPIYPIGKVVKLSPNSSNVNTIHWRCFGQNISSLFQGATAYEHF